MQTQCELSSLLTICLGTRKDRSFNSLLTAFYARELLFFVIVDIRAIDVTVLRMDGVTRREYSFWSSRAFAQKKFNLKENLSREEDIV